MKNEIVLKLENLMGIRFWQFDGLPEQIIVPLDDLIEEYGSEDMLFAMKSLITEFENEEFSSAKSKGNSGFAGEMHMAAAMKLKYLNESIAYVLNKNK